MNILIYVYDDAEVLDFSGPFEVFATAARIMPADRSINVFLIGETGRPVTARAGFKVTPHYGFANHPTPGVLIIPGGVHDNEMLKAPVLTWIKQQAEQASVVASVCTGAFLLAAAGVITTHTVTTHWEDIPALQNQFPTLHVLADKRWTQDGNIITSAGISAGIDMSLNLLGAITDTSLVVKTARQMEYDWQPLS